MIQSGDANPPVMWSAEFTAMGIKCTAIQRLEARLLEQGKLDPREVSAAHVAQHAHHSGQ
jgi:hypothetical protein